MKTCIYAYVYLYSPIDVFLTHSESKMILESSEISLQRIYFFTGEMKHQVFKAFAPQKKPGSLGKSPQKTTRCRRECPVQNFRRRGPKVHPDQASAKGFVSHCSKWVLKIFCFFPTLEMDNQVVKFPLDSGWWSSRRMTVLDKHPPLQA